MAYARLSEPDSDVYMFASGLYRHCQWCRFRDGDGTAAGEHLERTPGGLLRHARAHLRAGHRVPARALNELRAEALLLWPAIAAWAARVGAWIRRWYRVAARGQT